MEANIPQGFIVDPLSEAHRRLMRTSNAIGRVKQELKRRTRVAFLCKISDEWPTGKINPKMNPTHPPQI